MTFHLKRMWSLSFFVFLVLFISSCGKAMENEEDPINEKNEIVLEDDDNKIINLDSLASCRVLKSGVISFEYQGNVYEYENPKLEIWLDTFKSEKDTSYWRLVALTVPFDNTIEMTITISDFEMPLEECIPETKYYDLNDYGERVDTSNFCVIHVTDNQNFLSLCNRSSSSLKKTSITGSSTSSYLDDHELEVTNCEEGVITGTFESIQIKNGKFCNIKIK